MKTRHFNLLLVLLLLLHPVTARTAYAPEKVVYDLTSSSPEEITHILDRVSFLQKVYDNNPFDASIVVVIHESAIPFFASGSRNKTISQRAKSLVIGEVIQFRVCSASAKMQGLTEKDFEAWIKLVPMADAEIIKLQKQGYAYIK